LHSSPYFELIVPVGFGLLGIALLACWSVLRQQRFLPWMAAGYMLPAVALAAQSAMSNAELARWAVLTGLLYMVGLWSLARGLAMRHGQVLRSWSGLLIGGLTLALLFYHSWIDDRIGARAVWLTAGVAAMLMLPLRGVMRSATGGDWLERLLKFSYVTLLAYCLLRVVLVAWVIPFDEIPRLTRSGYWQVLLAGTLVFGIGFMCMLLACAVRDVTRALREERDHDSLTGLFNRRAFIEVASARLEDRRLGPWTLLACDLDHFKQVNDAWGHAAGDQVLQGVARVLLAQVRDDDVVARFGGEEFVVLLGRAGPEAAAEVAQRIQAQLARHRFDAMPDTVTASFGLAPVASAADLLQALAQADSQMYEAKRAGRNCIRALSTASAAGEAVAVEGAAPARETPGV